MKVAIAGYGIEGKSSYDYFRGRGDDVTIVSPTLPEKSELPSDASVKTGEDVFRRLNGFDLVLRTPSLPPNAITTDGTVWSQTNEFFKMCPAPIVGITGTKGKGTTASLITSILRASGQKVHLVGNIGVAPLSVLKDIEPSDVVVYELSSFQLWDAEKSPQIAVVVMIEPDHLDVHASLEEYLNAKSNIAKYQTVDDTVIYHPTNTFSQQIASAGDGKKVRYAVHEDGQVYVQKGFFMKAGEVICPVAALKLPGQHNIDNACAAISAALDCGGRMDAVEAGLSAFHGLPHRLRFVRTINEVQYYDDSIATTVGSAIAALHSFAGRKIIILGGSDKGADYQELISACKDSDAMVIAIGQTGERIAELCKEQAVACERVEGLMEDVVARAAALAAPGDTVILSPACASFDQYTSYSHRGDMFVAAVEGL